MWRNKWVQRISAYFHMSQTRREQRNLGSCLEVRRLNRLLYNIKRYIMYSTVCLFWVVQNKTIYLWGPEKFFVHPCPKSCFLESEPDVRILVKGFSKGVHSSETCKGGRKEDNRNLGDDEDLAAAHKWSDPRCALEHEQ